MWLIWIAHYLDYCIFQTFGWHGNGEWEVKNVTARRMKENNQIVKYEYVSKMFTDKMFVSWGSVKRDKSKNIKDIYRIEIFNLQVCVSLSLQRHPSFFITVIILPCFILNVLCVFGMFIDKSNDTLNKVITRSRYVSSCLQLVIKAHLCWPVVLPCISANQHAVGVAETISHERALILTYCITVHISQSACSGRGRATTIAPQPVNVLRCEQLIAIDHSRSHFRWFLASQL